ncbi:hypothetical protein VB715_18095 [Crocosphaera sp. UHCC 0190]|uniref:hypothetical protein n=1 Tax=Crocosphaera sp. UHCC 0190 TaxID=3110246 RepID=UPI002B1FF090|nr:hypothetical protein [Crocosphaera sp. UHCC 0190]MEA5511689.1 hypothetical protein [Crocosphaera sp. UHCC 0190]
MTELSLDKNLLKETLKTAILEIIQENPDEFQKLLTEVIEDIAMTQAIEEGEKTELVDRDSIFNLLNRES